MNKLYNLTKDKGLDRVDGLRMIYTFFNAYQQRNS